ncbi:MAG: DinB family protein [Clostridia bacterium]|nr:DinB family protein [Clostridia bacterium]
MSNTLINSIQEQTDLIFYNMSISMQTCDRDFDICGAPAWRYVYHTLHSCDKWFRNPNDFVEPEIHTENLDKVDLPCDKVLSDHDLHQYFVGVRERTLNHLASLEDSQLSERPSGCEFTRLELILGQFRHFMCHIGILNGMTIAKKNKYPQVYGLDKWKANKMGGGLYEE